MCRSIACLGRQRMGETAVSANPYSPFRSPLCSESPPYLFLRATAARKIERYATDLKPDLKDTHMLEAKDGILWSFGFKDLAWFDGSRWTRVDHPDRSGKAIHRDEPAHLQVCASP